MTVLEKIATLQGRRDEIPNQELAGALAAARDRAGLREIADNLWNKNPAIQSDCLKVLYETGYLDPELVADYAGDFLKLLKSRNNRLVWGSMIALSTIAAIRPAEINAQRALIQQTMENGSVITVDNGVKILALVASSLPDEEGEILAYLLHHLKTCRPKDVPQHSEKILAAVNPSNRDAFIQVLEQRLADLSGAQLTRVKKVIRQSGG